MMTHHEMARTSAGLVDRSMRGTVEVRGADRRTFLHALLTNDITSLVPGQGCYAAWLTPQGRLITDMRIVALDDRLWIDVRAADAAALAARLDRLVFTEDVQVSDASAAVSQVRVVGPASAGVVSRALAAVAEGAAAPPPADLTAWQEYRSASFPGPGTGRLVVVRDDGLGVPGFDVYVGPDDAAAVRAALAARGVTPLDEATVEALRIEAGRPAFGVDMDTETIPLEAGIEDRAISFSKGCYVGQEVIVRVTTRGQGRVARKLVGLVLEGDRVPVRGDVVLAGDRAVGHVTSAAFSPLVGRPVALAMVHRDAAAPATAVAVGAATRDGASVVALPLSPLSPAA
jgi:folate-binding protein YgfZ